MPARLPSFLHPCLPASLAALCSGWGITSLVRGWHTKSASFFCGAMEHAHTERKLLSEFLRQHGKGEFPQEYSTLLLLCLPFPGSTSNFWLGWGTAEGQMGQTERQWDRLAGRQREGDRQTATWQHCQFRFKVVACATSACHRFDAGFFYYLPHATQMSFL